MRKFITSIAVIAMAAAMMTGCGQKDTAEQTENTEQAENTEEQNGNSEIGRAHV